MLQLAGACSNPEVGIELRRMAKAAAMIARDRGLREPVARHSSRQPRPGWVLELVLAVLASSSQPLRPQEVIQRAERVHGSRLAPSSIRNALRVASQRHDDAVERVGYGQYRLRPDHRPR
jgi:hypothetical protein